MTLMVGLHGPDKAEALNFTSDGREMASVTFSEGDRGVTLFTDNRALAHDLAQVFEMHAKDSPFLGLLDLLLTAENDPNRDTIADFVRAAQFHADACCPACGQYRPDDDEWREIDGRLMCASCCDDEAAKYAEMHAHAPSAAELRRPGLAVYAMTEGL